MLASLAASTIAITKTTDTWALILFVSIWTYTLADLVFNMIIPCLQCASEPLPATPLLECKDNDDNISEADSEENWETDNNDNGESDYSHTSRICNNFIHMRELQDPDLPHSAISVNQCTWLILQTIAKWVLLMASLTITPVTATEGIWSVFLPIILRAFLLADLLSNMIIPSVQWFMGITSLTCQGVPESLSQALDTYISDNQDGEADSDPYYNERLMLEDPTHQSPIVIPTREGGDPETRLREDDLHHLGSTLENNLNKYVPHHPSASEYEQISGWFSNPQEEHDDDESLDSYTNSRCLNLASMTELQNAERIPPNLVQIGQEHPGPQTTAI